MKLDFCEATTFFLLVVCRVLSLSVHSAHILRLYRSFAIPKRLTTFHTNMHILDGISVLAACAAFYAHETQPFADVLAVRASIRSNATWCAVLLIQISSHIWVRSIIFRVSASDVSYSPPANRQTGFFVRSIKSYAVQCARSTPPSDNRGALSKLFSHFVCVTRKVISCVLSARKSKSTSTNVARAKCYARISANWINSIVQKREYSRFCSAAGFARSAHARACHSCLCDRRS